MRSEAAAERRVRALLPLIRVAHAYLPLAVMRGLIGLGMRVLRPPAAAALRPVSAAGVPCLWLIPEGAEPGSCLLYLHGGGFVLGLTPLHVTMVAHLAREMGVPALLVDYRLGPEHPFPAALEDCLAAYRWLLGRGTSPDDIVVAGDSAGGNLTLAVAMKLRDAGEPLPAALACLSPAGRLTRPEEVDGLAADPLLHPRALRLYDVSYVGSRDPREPLISPVFGDWHGLPPLLVHAGEDEILAEDAVEIERAARAAGVDVRLEMYPRMWHVWQLYLSLPQARRSLDDIARFLGSHLASVRGRPRP